MKLVIKYALILFASITLSACGGGGVSNVSSIDADNSILSKVIANTVGATAAVVVSNQN